MAQMSEKMKLRADLMAILSKYRNTINPKSSDFNNDLEHLRTIKDKKYILKALFKELINANGNFANICAVFLLELGDMDTFEDCAIDFLKDSNITDDKKFFIISLMKQKGIHFDYENIQEYIKNPNSTADKGIKDFLVNATVDPEVQIDLLDFYLNIPYQEKLYLLSSLVDDETISDNIINALSLLVQLNLSRNELDIILPILLETESFYAIDALNYVLENYHIKKEEISPIKRALRRLKRNNKEEKINDVTKDSKIYESLISFVDGTSSFSAVFSRQFNDTSIDACFITISIPQGIVSCMGFGNIEVENYISIKRRLFSDSIPIKINPIALKSLLAHYQNKNIKTKTEIPYEYIVWKTLFNDVSTINYDISEFLNSKLETLNLTEEKVKNFISTKMLETWFFAHKQYEEFDKLLELIEKKHIINLDEIDKYTDELVQNVFMKNKKFMTELKDRLLIQAYVSHLAHLKMSSATSYSLCFKNPYMNMFIEAMIDKGIYQYFADIIYNKNENIENIFQKNSSSNFTQEELELIMSQIEEKWS